MNFGILNKSIHHLEVEARDKDPLSADKRPQGGPKHCSQYSPAWNRLQE